MYKVKVMAEFSGAHFLRGYKGKCESLHGHNWEIEVIAKSETLDELGMVIDFKKLKGFINVVMEELDHKHLNDLEYFEKINPSSENIAKYIYDRLLALMTDEKAVLCKVRVWETSSSCAVYEE
ncbi:MAG: 6-carboxytetrahydropterin synthase QueD [Candidatus Omnitrophica bacterium]|jgi:6-pyruvoyltetrahydropterin/6-carboxytetrahydropterin synthase|nr:6-carboxytetrahydropterin synthase QueD [Candidatus Omnitrophota bacterium]MDD5081459.1 6-carboxytetrahydropterin synthase QueD [Candidatus Omnitrophota bacterium]